MCYNTQGKSDQLVKGNYGKQAGRENNNNVGAVGMWKIYGYQVVA